MEDIDYSWLKIMNIWLILMSLLTLQVCLFCVCCSAENTYVDKTFFRKLHLYLDIALLMVKIEGYWGDLDNRWDYQRSNLKIYFSRYDSSTIKDEKGCPRCGGAVFQNEEIIEKGISYHKKCFTCHQCNRPLTDKLQVFNGFDQEIYCKVCYPKIVFSIKKLIIPYN